jgi:hypothetical protein
MRSWVEIDTTLIVFVPGPEGRASLGGAVPATPPTALKSEKTREQISEFRGQLRGQPALQRTAIDPQIR